MNAPFKAEPSPQGAVIIDRRASERTAVNVVGHGNTFADMTEASRLAKRLNKIFEETKKREES